MATAQERHDAVENRKKENQESFEDLLYSPDYEEKKHIKAAVEAIKLARIQLRDERKKRDDEKKEERRKTEDKEERTIIQTSDSYYEQVQGHKFARKTTSGKVELVDEVVIGSKIITPVHGGELEEGRETVILPPAEPAEYVSVEALVEDVRSFIHKWVDVTPEYETFSSWYVLLTWVYDKMPSLNYLSMMGDTGVGKSRSQDAIGRICYRAILGSGAVSVAALKRLQGRWHGTILIDEGDFKISDETAELIKFLNLGFERNRRMFNCDKNDPSQLEFFDPYGPKIISRRRQFQDQALEARCLTEVMRQTQRKDILPILTSEFYNEQNNLRAKLWKFRLDYKDLINPDSIARVDLGDVEPRLKQATLAFAALFSNVPGSLEYFKKFLKGYQERIIEERGQSFDGQIVNAIATLVESGREELSSGDITVLNARGQAVSDKVIGQHLRQLGVVTHQKRVDGKVRRVIVWDDAVLGVCKRYLTPDKLVAVVAFVASHSSMLQQSQTTLNSACNKKIHVHDTHATNATHDTEIINFIHTNPTDNAVKLDEEYPELIIKLKKEGTIYEPKPGTYALVDPGLIDN